MPITTIHPQFIFHLAKLNLSTQQTKCPAPHDQHPPVCLWESHGSNSCGLASRTSLFPRAWAPGSDSRGLASWTSLFPRAWAPPGSVHVVLDWVTFTNQQEKHPGRSLSFPLAAWAPQPGLPAPYSTYSTQDHVPRFLLDPAGLLWSKSTRGSAERMGRGVWDRKHG